MKYHFFSLAVGLIMVGAGCTAAPVSPVVNVTEQFALTTTSQQATFMIGSSWTGGMGTMPVFEWETDRVKHYDGLPVYFDESYRALVQEKLPTCVSGRPRIMVSANITLEKKSDTNDSVEDAPTETYFTAKVNQLDRITVNAEPC